MNGRTLQVATIAASLTSLVLLLQATYGSAVVVPVALLAHSWIGPFSLLAGGAMHPGAFLLWQPFQGGGAFVGLQATGWTMYSISIVFGWCILLESDPPSIGTAAFVGILSWLVLLKMA